MQSDPVILAIDSLIADGTDVSWLWDVDFEQLAGRRVIATGPRSADLAVRLSYAEVAHEVIPDIADALAGPFGDTVDVLATYSAFLRLCRMGGGGAEMTHKIVVVYQSLLVIYGDRGNAKVLLKRCSGGTDAELIDVEPGQPVPDDGLVYLLGGKEDQAAIAAAKALQADGGPQAGLAAGAVLFAVCAGYQLCGHSFTVGEDDQVYSGLGLLTSRPGAATSARSVRS